MPICIECRFPISTLYTTYSKADDKALGKGVRLTQCPRCKRFADKYVEHDFVVLFIDLVLIKPQVSFSRRTICCPITPLQRYAQNGVSSKNLFSVECSPDSLNRSTAIYSSTVWPAKTTS